MNIVSTFTQTNEFGTTDDLYTLGFTSLTLMRLNSAIYEEMDINLDIITILNNPTIKTMPINIRVTFLSKTLLPLYTNLLFPI